MGAFQVAFRDELATPLSPATIDELRWYFEQLRLAATSRRLASDPRVRRAQHVFAAPRFRVLYRRWLTDGEAAFDVVSSHAIIEGLADETGCVDSRVLLIPYRHLSPLANRVRSAGEGLRRGPQTGTNGPHALNPVSPIRKRMSPLAVHATGTGSLRPATHNRSNELRWTPRDGRGGGWCRPNSGSGRYSS